MKLMKVMKGRRITIPKEVVVALELEKADYATLSVEDGRIVLKPVKVAIYERDAEEGK